MFRMSFSPFLLQLFRMNYTDIAKVSPDFREYFCKVNSLFTKIFILHSQIHHHPMQLLESGISFNIKIIPKCFHKHSHHGQSNPDCRGLPAKVPFYCKICVCICGFFLTVMTQRIKSHQLWSCVRARVKRAISDSDLTPKPQCSINFILFLQSFQLFFLLMFISFLWQEGMCPIMLCPDYKTEGSWKCGLDVPMYCHSLKTQNRLLIFQADE